VVSGLDLIQLSPSRAGTKLGDDTAASQRFPASVPILDYGKKLRLGPQLAVSYGNIREHEKAPEITQQ
jgi:hypothetical protein